MTVKFRRCHIIEFRFYRFSFNKWSRINLFAVYSHRDVGVAEKMRCQ